MSTNVFPSFAGIGIDVKRTPVFGTTVQTSVSGKETRIALQSYPRWTWELTCDLLRQGTVNGSAFTELSQLAGFFNSRQGMFDSFLYTDAEDNTVAAQHIGAGDGVQTQFQIVRAFGGFVEPVLAPHTVSHVYLNGVNQASGWSVANWGTASPGVVTFTSPPANGVAITADFTYYWPCRFTDDTMTFSKFMNLMWEAKSIKFMSLKN